MDPLASLAMVMTGMTDNPDLVQVVVLIGQALKTGFNARALVVVDFLHSFPVNLQDVLLFGNCVAVSVPAPQRLDGLDLFLHNSSECDELRSSLGRWWACVR